MEKKKTKLTISGSSKKTISHIERAKTQGKNSVIIEKKVVGFGNKANIIRKNNENTHSKTKVYRSSKQSILNKPQFPSGNDFEKRKLAEQRATKRLKGEVKKEKSA